MLGRSADVAGLRCLARHRQTRAGGQPQRFIPGPMLEPGKEDPHARTWLSVIPRKHIILPQDDTPGMHYDVLTGTYSTRMKLTSDMALHPSALSHWSQLRAEYTRECEGVLPQIRGTCDSQGLAPPS
jgi:hypothetical protein